MDEGQPGAVFCGTPMRFYNLNRPRDDYAPTCHRPPHEGKRHASGASMEREKQRQRENRHRRRRRSRARNAEAPGSSPGASHPGTEAAGEIAVQDSTILVLSDPPDTVTP